MFIIGCLNKEIIQNVILKNWIVSPFNGPADHWRGARLNIILVMAWSQIYFIVYTAIGKSEKAVRAD